MPEGAEEGIVRGIYRLKRCGLEDQESPSPKHVRLLGSGTILREVIAAAETLFEDYGVTSDVYSVTSFTELARDGADTERWNLLHPAEVPRTSYLEQVLAGGDAPVIASTDYVRSHAGQIATWINAPYHPLGTDGFGRSDTRQRLREFFEVDRRFVCLTALFEPARLAK